MKTRLTSVTLALMVATSAVGANAASPEETPATAPVPPAKPGQEKLGSEAGSPAPPAPSAESTRPEPRPDEKPAASGETKGDGSASQPPDKPDAPPRPTVSEAEDKACRMRLQELGVRFEEASPLSDPAGCGVERPLTVTSLGKDIALEPAATMNCQIAEAAARYAQDVIRPATEAAFQSRLDRVSQASAYVCRPRHGTQKLSEHAFGNALDIAALRLADGRTMPVQAESDPVLASFWALLRAKACGAFKTVLGPGSDADHATHLHLDLQPRRNGSTFCQ